MEELYKVGDKVPKVGRYLEKCRLKILFKEFFRFARGNLIIL